MYSFSLKMAVDRAPMDTKRGRKEEISVKFVLNSNWIMGEKIEDRNVKFGKIQNVIPKWNKKYQMRNLQ